MSLDAVLHGLVLVVVGAAGFAFGNLLWGRYHRDDLAERSSNALQEFLAKSPLARELGERLEHNRQLTIAKVDELTDLHRSAVDRGHSLVDRERRLAQAAMSVAACDGELDRLRVSVDERTRLGNELERLAAAAHVTATEASNLAEKLRAELADKDRRTVELERALSAAEEIHASRVEERQRIEKETARIGQQLEEVARELVAVSSESQQKGAAIDRSRGSFDELRDDERWLLGEARHASSDADQRRVELERALSAATATRTKEAEARVHLEVEIARIGQQLEEATRELAASSCAGVEATATVEHLRGSLNQLRDEDRRLQGDGRRVAAEADARRVELERALGTAEEIRASRAEQLRRVEAEVERLERELDESGRELAPIALREQGPTAELEELRRRIEPLGGDEVSLRAASRRLSAELELRRAEMGRAIAAAEEMRAARQEERRRLEDDGRRHQDELDEAGRQLATLQREAAERGPVLDQHRDAIDGLRLEQTRRREEIVFDRERAEHDAQRLGSVRGEIGQAKQRQDQLTTESSETAATEAEAKRRLEALLRDLPPRKQETEAMARAIAVANSSVEALQAEVGQLQSTIGSQQSRRQSLSERLTDARPKLRRLDDDQHLLTRALGEAEAALNSTRTEVLALTERLGSQQQELERVRAEAADTDAKLSELKRAVEATEGALARGDVLAEGRREETVLRREIDLLERKEAERDDRLRMFQLDLAELQGAVDLEAMEADSLVGGRDAADEELRLGELELRRLTEAVEATNGASEEARSRARGQQAQVRQSEDRLRSLETTIASVQAQERELRRVVGEAQTALRLENERVQWLEATVREQAPGAALPPP